jgi:PAS domain-containing protein
MSDQLDVLILEDRELDAELMLRTLSAEGLRVRARRVWTPADFEAALLDPLDLILADYHLPAYDGLSALAVSRRLCPRVPFIVVSGTVGEEFAIEALHRGATDYVLKQRLERLGPAVRRAVRETGERRERERAERELARSERRFRTIFDRVSDGILLADPVTGAFVMANQSICAMLGYSQDELLRLRVDDLHPGLESSGGGFRVEDRGAISGAHDRPNPRRGGWGL